MRRGFTLVEVLVALAIMVILAATITPNIMGALDRARIERAATTLNAIVEAQASLEADTNHSAKFISQLGEAVASNDPDICDKNFTGQASNWAGPYITRIAPGTGLPVGIGIAQNQFLFTNQSGNQDLATIIVDDVTIEDARSLDLEVDGIEDGVTGSVRYGAAVNGFVTLNYVFPIPNC